MAVGEHVVTHLFTDLEGSTRLWDQQPARMEDALRRHDRHARAAVAHYGGRVVKTTGDGIHAVFDDPLSAVVFAPDLRHLLFAEDSAEVTRRVRYLPRVSQ